MSSGKGSAYLGNGLVRVPSGISVVSRTFRRILNYNFEKCTTEIVGGKGVIAEEERPGQYRIRIDESVVRTRE